MHRILYFFAAVVTTYVLSVLMYTQLNLGNLVEMGLEVPFAVRMSAAGHDLLGMSILYLPMIAVGLLVGFLIAGIVLRWLPQLETLGYIVAGFIGIWALIEITTLPFSTHLIPVTRTTVGLLTQCVAGAAGGWVFATLLIRRRQQTSAS